MTMIKYYLKPKQKELNHLYVVYDKTFNEFKTIDLRSFSLIGNYQSCFTNEFIEKHIDDINLYELELIE